MSFGIDSRAIELLDAIVGLTTTLAIGAAVVLTLFAFHVAFASANETKAEQ